MTGNFGTALHSWARIERESDALGKQSSAKRAEVPADAVAWHSSPLRPPVRAGPARGRPLPRSPSHARSGPECAPLKIHAALSIA